MSDTKPDNPEQATAIEPKKSLDKAVAPAAKAAKVESSEVLSFRDYADRVVVVTRAGQKITVAK